MLVLLIILVESFFIHLAARVLTRQARFSQAVGVAIGGGLLASLTLWLLGPAWWAKAVAVFVWLAVASGIYRIGYLRALLIGLLAALFFLLAQWLLGDILARLLR